MGKTLNKKKECCFCKEKNKENILLHCEFSMMCPYFGFIGCQNLICCTCIQKEKSCVECKQERENNKNFIN